MSVYNTLDRGTVQRITSSSCVDVQLGQRQGERHLSALRVGGTLQDVMQGVPSARPARSDEVCVCGLNIRHRSRIVHTATPTRRAAVHLLPVAQLHTPQCVLLQLVV